MDLQQSSEFQATGVTLLSISPDDPEAWGAVAAQTGLTTPLLSDQGNEVAEQYGVMRWRVGSEPGHTFVVVDAESIVQSIRDYGAPENGGLMYVEVARVVDFVREDLAGAPGDSR